MQDSGFIRNWLIAISLLLSLAIAGCKTPPVPPEIKKAEIQEKNLWRAGASMYAADDYNKYLMSYREAKDMLIKENAKFSWFRDYEAAEAAFRNILNEGEKILEKAQKQKEIKSSSISNQIASFRDRIYTLQSLTLMINQGRFARLILIRTELMLMEADLMQQRGNFEAAEKKLKDVDFYLKDAEDLVFSALDRYRDKTLITKWDKWVRETLFESKQKGIFVLIVSKIDHKLKIFKNGQLFSTFEIGLGRNSLIDKLHAGDYATPEGRYHIVKKLSTSRYYKALLLDYPNQDDKKQFYLGREKGIVPPGVGIGGLIELHGGGKDSLTDGCISLENKDIDKIFELVDVGTPVTIVGSFNFTN